MHLGRIRAPRAVWVRAFALTLTALVVACAGFVFVSAPGGKHVVVEIPPGSATPDIADRLARSGVVGNAQVFRALSRLSHADGRLKPGVYELETGTSYAGVIRALEAGPSSAYATVTIPEGFTIKQMAQRFASGAGVDAAAFERVASTQAVSFKPEHAFLASNGTPSLEGYLFPDTYRVKRHADPRAVIEMMLEQFGAETAGLDLRRATASGLTLHGVVTIASMVEREVRLQRERPLAASVIENRLAKGVPLEIDATVRYVTGKKRRLLYRDLAVRSPYNTYLHSGLPPGPIASPGLPSLKAAAQPADTPYEFYVLTGKDGSHTFTADKASFLAAKARAKEGLR